MFTGHLQCLNALEAPLHAKCLCSSHFYPSAEHDSVFARRKSERGESARAIRKDMIVSRQERRRRRQHLSANAAFLWLYMSPVCKKNNHIIFSPPLSHKEKSSNEKNNKMQKRRTFRLPPFLPPPGC